MLSCCRPASRRDILKIENKIVESWRNVGYIDFTTGPDKTGHRNSLLNIVRHCIAPNQGSPNYYVLECTVLYCTVLYCTVLCCSLKSKSTVPHSPLNLKKSSIMFSTRTIWENIKTLCPCEKSRGSSLSSRDNFPEDSIIFDWSIEILSLSSNGKSEMILSSTPLREEEGCKVSTWKEMREMERKEEDKEGWS